MKHILLPAVAFMVALVVQLWAQLDHRIVALMAFLVLLCSWISLWRATNQTKPQSNWIGPVILTLAGMAVAIAVAAPPATSKDFNSYALYGRMVTTYDASPYTHRPIDFATDTWFPRTSYFWSDSPSVYGPVFTGLSAGIMSVAGTSSVKARLGFQGLAALSLIACVALLSRRLGWTRAAVMVGLNPLLLTFGVNDAHCDVLIGLCVLAGILALERRWFIAAGALLAIGASVKIAALPAIAGAALWAFSCDKRSRNKRLLAALQVLGGAAVVMIAAIGAAGGRDALAPLKNATSRHTRFSIWNPVHNVFSGYGNVDAIVSLGANAVVATVGGYMLWRHRKDVNAAVAVVVGLVVYQLFGAYVLSWYAAWSIPALALMPKSRTAWLAMGHGCWVAMAYFSGYGVLVVTVAVVAELWILLRRRNRESLAVP